MKNEWPKPLRTFSNNNSAPAFNFSVFKGRCFK